MKAEKLIGLYLAPHFFAISLLFAFIASRCGFASFCACSYVIAPECSHILIVLISSVWLIISLLIVSFPYALDFKGRPLIFQGFSRFFLVFPRFFCGIPSFFAFSGKAFFRLSGAASVFPAVRGVFSVRKRLGKRLEYRLGNG